MFFEIVDTVGVSDAGDEKHEEDISLSPGGTPSTDLKPEQAGSDDKKPVSLPTTHDEISKQAADAATSSTNVHETNSQKPEQEAGSSTNLNDPSANQPPKKESSKGIFNTVTKSITWFTSTLIGKPGRAIMNLFTSNSNETTPTESDQPK
ncbi:hypothetical protein V9T40_005275 [Parthenolecanium corni]|uniref:Uncharacterized protein n=1 Tax=Parthenolecanium corni TaxID=536013 RepID=A0AAN9Y2X7_9HEMI